MSWNVETEKTGVPASEAWINPIGGLGDMLMVSGVLKQVIERDPERRFRLIRRSGYMRLFRGHPAILDTGFPEQDAKVMGTDYWAKELLGPGRQRPMQVLARMYGLSEPVEERFHVVENEPESPLLQTLPWTDKTVIVAPGSLSPRKAWAHKNWEALCRRLREAGFFLLEVGDVRARHVRSTYSIHGLIQPKQVFAFLRRAKLVVTVDCFLMHAAHHVSVPAVVLWGPTPPEVYGYAEQCHLFAGKVCQKPDGCIGPGKGVTYSTACPLPHEHCVDLITVDQVFDACRKIFQAQRTP
jgi:ADP-heptose:LPS heptosyltransferase